jgi:hypothetical protein
MLHIPKFYILIPNLDQALRDTIVMVIRIFSAVSLNCWFVVIFPSPFTNAEIVLEKYQSSGHSYT